MAHTTSQAATSHIPQFGLAMGAARDTPPRFGTPRISVHFRGLFHSET